MAKNPLEMTTEELIKNKPKSLKNAEKDISQATAPVEVVPEEVKAEYEVLELPADNPPEEPAPVVNTANDIDLNNPKEGDSYVDEYGNVNNYKNGIWVVTVGHNKMTGNQHLLQSIVINSIISVQGLIELKLLKLGVFRTSFLLFV